jgi:hypothetical protein
VVRTRLLSALELSVHEDKLDIGLILDVRAGGRRYYALREAYRPAGRHRGLTIHLHLGQFSGAWPSEGIVDFVAQL